MSEIRAVAGTADGGLPRKPRESPKRDDEARPRPKRAKESPAAEPDAGGAERRKLDVNA